jgi:hypothetical protein
MSGITSIGREAAATFYPQAVSPNRLFTFCLWACFVVSAVVLIVWQQFEIADLEQEIDNKKTQAVVRESLGGVSCSSTAVNGQNCQQSGILRSMEKRP